jgi:hypothetical protein
MPPPNGLSKRQQTMAALFPRRARAHQLGLGPDFSRPAWRCPGCGHELSEQRGCDECGAFACTSCDTITTANGGDGSTCYGCQVRP